MASSGHVQIEVLAQGHGERKTKAGDEIKILCQGSWEEGSKLDPSYNRERTLNFTIGKGEIIKEWDEGVRGMLIGEKRKLTIRPTLEYGVQPIGPIPADSTLFVEVELVKIN